MHNLAHETLTPTLTLTRTPTLTLTLTLTPTLTLTLTLTTRYVTLCHELAHNTEALHNLAHESCMEQLIASYLPQAMDAIDR